MSKHGTGVENRQFVSRPLVAGALIVILIAAVITAWVGLGDRIEESATDSADQCVEGNAAVPIVADPALAPGLQKIAQSYNATSPIVRDHCIKVEVRPADARATLEGLTADRWDPAAFGPFPGAWIPESSVWAAALQTGKPAALQGPPESLVSSPVRLAVEKELAEAADGRIGWGDLPELTRASSLEAYGQPTWGSLRMAMPNGPQSDATALAAQGVAAAIADEKGSLTEEQVGESSVTQAVEQLLSAPPKPGDGSISAAIKAIGEADDPSDAEVRAVPVTEQRLYTLTKDDESAPVTAVAPEGSTPVADYPVIKLAGAQVPAFLGDAISEFLTFARKPPQMKVLTEMGFRGGGPLPQKTATVAFGEVTDPLPAPEPAAALRISEIVLPAAAP
ncbi:substrate-binding domain-containing protein [Gordonia zhaorongruii]|uniref:substrate-binding domain-containing protein n=1 Tax=Gordonia zhaorongruii TaxID=2597659 RepID=UPI00105298CA|nr:substrate-binding domain-containing protein [Gordonia zhaorongruii]